MKDKVPEHITRSQNVRELLKNVYRGQISFLVGVVRHWEPHTKRSLRVFGPSHLYPQLPLYPLSRFQDGPVSSALDDPSRRRASLPTHLWGDCLRVCLGRRVSTEECRTTSSGTERSFITRCLSTGVSSFDSYSGRSVTDSMSQSY